MLLANLLSAPILFFILGGFAVLVRSDLSIPPPLSKALSLYLLIAIGVHGGVEIAGSGIDSTLIYVLGSAVLFSAITPLWCYPLLKRFLDSPNAAAVAACYGSVSAVTFLTACAYLKYEGIPFSGSMVAAMALMETPAIIVGVVLARSALQNTANPGALLPTDAKPMALRSIVHEGLTGGPVILLLGGLAVGLMIGKPGWSNLEPFLKEPFKGVLCLFMLEMGMVATRRIGALRGRGPGIWVFALVAPFIHGLLGIVIARLIGLEAGDALLFALLIASASYIAVPAAMRLSVPQADPGLYVPMALAITFPYNIIVGIPLNHHIITYWWAL